MSVSMTTHSPEVNRLIEQQLRNWELSRQQGRGTGTTPPRRAVREFIAVSRQVASGGSEVARLVGERLKWPVFDREILQAMAGDDAARERVYTAMDERDIGWLEEMMRWLVREEPHPQDYFKRLTRTVLSLARGGNALFLGRGADLILPRECGLRVRVVAPLEQRARTFVQRLNTTLSKAREEIERIDRERTEFVHSHFRAADGDDCRFDLVLNTGRLSTSDAAEIVLHAARLKGVVGTNS